MCNEYISREKLKSWGKDETLISFIAPICSQKAASEHAWAMSHNDETSSHDHFVNVQSSTLRNCFYRDIPTHSVTPI